MKLHNTLTKKTEEFTPIQKDIVTLYTCGPTVYDYYHIGNLRNAVFNDTLKRTLEASGFNVKHVMNITDVGHLVSDGDEGEDKLEKGASREGKTVWEVAEHYTTAFKHDMLALNIFPPNGYASKKYHDSYARATEFIPEQLALVKLLVDKEYAYQTKQAIYFDVTKLDDYGILSGQRLSDKEIGARTSVITDTDKKNPQDFAVWFFAVGHFADHTMQWESQWGSGFPGWHLECSAIIHATLGDPIDIHTGGIDHIGTHHPNEMAQTEAAYGNKLANFWVHNEFILVDGQKMAKSKGNAYTLKDVVSKGYEPLAYRLLVLQAHYRSELNFSWENLEAAQARLQKLRSFADLRWQPVNTESWLQHSLDNDALLVSLQDDLNTPIALSILSGLAVQAEEKLIAETEIKVFIDLLERLDRLFGLDLSKREDITTDQKGLVQQRQRARDSKDWAKSDELRDTLKKQGLSVRDTPQGQVWERI